MPSEEIKQLESRIEELETRESFHDYTVEQLNEIIIEQQNRLEYLERGFKLLVNKLKNREDQPLENASIMDEKPPHY